jgi:hypothetical protein
MFTEAIYYPYILIPDNQWLRKTILYWDKIFPIVPLEVEEQIPQKHISKQLKERGVLDFIHPEEVLNYNEGEKLSGPFLRIVESEEFRSEIARPEKRVYSERIHRHKFAEPLLDQLRGLDLFKVESGTNWLLFEGLTGRIYMGFLASSLAKIKNLEPITDQEVFQRGFLQSQLIPSQGSEIFISVVLEKLLPAPRNDIPVDNILKFKEKHESELLAFRRVIRDVINSLKYEPDKDRLWDIVNSAESTVKEQCSILERKLEESKIETVFNALQVSFYLTKPEIAAMGIALASSNTLGVTLFGVDSLIKIGREIFNGTVRHNSILEANPYSYVFHVKKQLTK